MATFLGLRVYYYLIYFQLLLSLFLRPEKEEEAADALGAISAQPGFSGIVEDMF